MNGTKAGQFIQALKKYSNTKEGALVNATKVLVDETNAWTKRNKKAVKTNTDLAESLNLLGKQNNFTESDVNSEGYSEGESKGNAPRRRGDVTIRNESNEPREMRLAARADEVMYRAGLLLHRLDVDDRTRRANPRRNHQRELQHAVVHI